MLRVVQYYCNFPLWIDHLFVHGYNEAKTPANRIIASIQYAVE